MRKNIKRYTAILLTIAMALPGSPVYGNMEEEYERLLEMENSEEHQKATDSNAQQKDESWQDDEDEEDLYEDEDLLDDLHKASPSDADEADEADEVELEQDLETGKKILSWEWNDEQDALINGELQLAVTAEDQVSFDDIVSMLPESITANVREDGETTETEISVTGWKCEQYETDEDEKWPTEGTYLFEAELPEEYELDADADELMVKVVLEAPEVMPLDDLSSEVVIAIKTNSGTWKNQFSFSGDTFKGEGYSITKESQENHFKLTLDGINTQGIDILKGTWTVELKNDNTLSGSSTNGFCIETAVDSVTFTGDGNLYISGKSDGFVGMSTVTMQGTGKITAVSTNDNASGGAFQVCNGSTLSIKSGTFDIQGKNYGLVIPQVDGKIYMSGGTITASGSSDAFWQIGPDTLMEITGGTMTCNGQIRQSNPRNQLNINGGKIIANGNLVIADGSSINLQAGAFELNGSCSDSSGTFTKTGGTLSGTGNLGNNKLDLTIEEKSNTSKTLSVGSSIDPGSFFELPSGNNTVTYSVTNGTGKAHIADGKLIGDSVGKVKLKVTVAESSFYKAAEKEIELTIEKRTLSRDAVNVTTYSGYYDGQNHDALTVLVDGKAPTDDMVVQYRTVENNQMSDYTSVMPQVKDCSDNSKYTYKVKISGENYETIEISVDDHVYIQPYNLSSAEVKLSSTEFTYNKNQQVPAVTACIKNSGVEIPESSYTVSYKKDDTACAKPTDAGTYQIVLTANSSDSNYTGTNADTKNTFQIVPRNLTPSIAGTLTKIYNGMTDVNDDVKIVLKDGSDTVTGITAKAASITYDDPNAGDAVGITATGIQIKGGNEQGNYALDTYTAKAVGAIQKATLLDVRVEQDGELHYNGKEQSATTQTRATAPFAFSDSVQFTYSLSENGPFAASVPAFKNEGNYTVFYKASCPNYKDYVDIFTVTILTGNLADATVMVGSDTSVYTGQEQTPSVKVKLGDVVLPETDYEVLYRRKDSVGGFVKPKDVGTYDMIIGGMNNMRGSLVQRTFKITEKSIEGDDILVSLSGTDLPYDGDVKHPSVTVMDTSRGEALIPGTDYTITMPDPVYPGEDYEITITGQGNYEGSKKAFYNVVKADLKDAAVTVSGTYVYQDSAVEPDGSQIAVMLNGKVVDPSEYEIAYADNAAIGTAKVLIQAKADGNYVGSTSGTFEIRDPKAGQEDNRPGGSPSGGGSSSGGSGSSGGGSSSSGSDRVTSASGTTKDSVKGSVSSDKGILTGANNSTANDGYSHWMQNEHGWWLRFADNSYPKAERRGESGIAYAWEQINGNWWAFDENGYAGSGWLRDEAFGGWFYADPDIGMRTGWVMINGSWYYFHSEPDGKKGLMYAGQKTPDGYYVDENGAWDGKEN